MNDTNEQRFIDVIHRFLNREIDPDAFCNEFTALWVQDRDEMYAKRHSWPEPYDQLLHEAWGRRELTDEEFQKKSAELWGYAENVEFRNMIDALHSSCDVFSPHPEQEWEINEEQLRLEVAQAIEKYEAHRK